MNKIITTLLEIGLNQKEISIYLELFSLGSAPASVLGRRTNIKRSTAMYACQQLHKKGLINRVQRGRTHLFSYTSPQKIKQLLQAKRDELKRKEGQVSEIVDELEGMIVPQAVMPKVQFFEGIESIAQGYQKVLNDLEEGDEIVGFVKTLDEKNASKPLRKAIDTFAKRRIEKKVFYRFIASATPEALKLKKEDAENYRETRLVPADAFEVSGTEIIVYKNKVYSILFEEGVFLATIVESKSLAQMKRNLFDLLWKSLEQ